MVSRAPVTTCEWMFDDGATGLLGLHALTKFNPLRWSGSQSFDVAISQLEEVLQVNDRPILVKAPANGGTPVRLPTVQQAINFLLRCGQVQDAQKKRAPAATISKTHSVRNTLLGSHTKYEIDVCEGMKRWTVQRRFSQFIELDAKLMDIPKFQMAELPSRGLFGLRHLCNIGDFNARRLDHLNEYLCEIVSHTSSLMDVPALGEFLGLPVVTDAAVEEQTQRNVFYRIDPQAMFGLPKPIFMLPKNDDEADPGIVEVAFAESEDVSNGLEVSVIFKDQGRPDHVEDVIHDMFGRSPHVETFTFVRGAGDKFDAIVFEGNYSGEQDWSCKAPSRLSGTVNLSEFRQVPGRSGSRTLLWVNVWDNLFGPTNNNPDMKHVGVVNYPCTHGRRKDIDNWYQGINA